METNDKNRRKRKAEDDYKVYVSDGTPSDIVEVISKAHAKAESMSHVRQESETDDLHRTTVPSKSAS